MIQLANQMTKARVPYTRKIAVWYKNAIPYV